MATRDPGDLDLARIPDPFAGEATSRSPPPWRGPRPAASPTRAQRRRRLALAAAAALLYQAGWVAVVERRADLGSLSAASIALGLSFPLGAAALAGGVALRRGSRGLGASMAALGSAMALAPLLFAIATLLVAPRDPTAGAWVFWDRAMRCMGVTGALTALPLALVAWACRRSFASASTWRTAALGGACGALAAATMSLACVHPEGLHVLIGHGSMMLAGAVAGALIGRRVTRA